MAELLIPEREGYDVDDTLVGREFVTRLVGFLKGRIRGHSFPGYTLDTLPVLDHTPVDLPGFNRSALWFNQRRKAIPGVEERLKLKASHGVELFAITGRIATTEWHTATADQLFREGIPIEKDHIYLTPLGESTIVSKAAAIRALGIGEYSDDDLKTILYLSGLFPDRKFNWVRHKLTSIPVPRGILLERPNIREIFIAKWKAV